MKRALALTLLSFVAFAITLKYDVVSLYKDGSVIGYGRLSVTYLPPYVSYNLDWESYCEPYYCSYFEILIKPVAKFVSFTKVVTDSKEVGMGALGLPYGVIPCTKYLVNEGGVSYYACVQRDVVVYEVYPAKDFEDRIILIPNLQALQVLKLETDPAGPIAKVVLTFIASVVSIAAIYSLINRNKVVIL